MPRTLRSSANHRLAAGLLVGIVLGLAACSSEVGLRVGDVTFATEDIRGLPDSQIDRLVLIATVGIATAREEPLTIVGPALAAGREDARITGLRRTLALERLGVTDAALEARYALDPDEELTVRHLVVLSERWRTDAERAEARGRAEAARERVLAGASFPDVAGEVSEEPGAAARGGLLEPGRAGTWVDEFWTAARELDIGEISPVVETEYGFHVLRLEDRTPVSFDEARARVAADIVAEIDDRGSWEAWIAERSGLPLDEVRTAYPLVPGPARDTLLAEAERRAIGVAEMDDATLVRDWGTRVARWAGLLGFEPGMTPEAIAEQSLTALGSTGQNAELVREEIMRSRESIERVYPVERPEP